MGIFDLKKEFGLYQISEIKLILVFCSHENNDRFALFCFVLFCSFIMFMKGFYADFDVAPGPKLTELTVHQNVSAFFLSDAWNRPSQWLIGIEPNHPIMYHTMLIIIEQLVHLADVSQVRLVFVTGPDSLKKGYTTVISTGDGGKEPYKQIFNTGIHRLRPPYPNKMVHKLDDSYTKTPDSISSRDTATKTTRKERVNKDMNTTHWKVHLAENRKNVQSGRCIDHLYKNSQDKTGSIE